MADLSIVQENFGGTVRVAVVFGGVPLCEAQTQDASQALRALHKAITTQLDAATKDPDTAGALLALLREARSLVQNGA